MTNTTLQPSFHLIETLNTEQPLSQVRLMQIQHDLLTLGFNYSGRADIVIAQLLEALTKSMKLNEQQTNMHRINCEEGRHWLPVANGAVSNTCVWCGKAK